MDADALIKRLREVEAHIATGEKLIGEAKKKLETAEQDGRDPVEGQEVIRTLELVQGLYIEERDRLQKAVKQLGH